MELTGERLAVTVPPGWDVRIGREGAGTPGEAPFLHAATFPLPAARGSFGDGAYGLMGPRDIFVAFLEYPSEAGSALFTLGRFPRRLDDQEFSPNAGHGLRPGQVALQRFFTEEDRAFCLYVVLGSLANRPLLVPVINAFLTSLRVERPSGSSSPPTTTPPTTTPPTTSTTTTSTTTPTTTSTAPPTTGTARGTTTNP